MPKSRESLCVLTELKNLSAEADRLADDLNVSDLKPFFDSIKETIIQINQCTTLKQLKEVKFPLDLHHYLNKEESEEKVKVIHSPETQKEHVHAENIASSVYKTAEKTVENGKKEKNGTSVCKSFEKDSSLEASLPTSEAKLKSVASLTKSSSKHTPKIPKTSYDVGTPKLLKTPAQQTIEIPAGPVLNRTITKENYQTPINKNLILEGEETTRVTRSDSRKKAQEGSSEVENGKREKNGTSVCKSFEKDRALEASLPTSEEKLKYVASLTKSSSKHTPKTRSCMPISSGLKHRLQGDENKSLSSQVQSGSKRKSASSDEQKSKKPKREAKNKLQTSQSKPTHKSNVLRPANGPALNPKAPAVIVPTLKHSITSDINIKEKKLEEIQKKEEKANENRKKVLADRQLKAEEQKKKREEKMEKALQKRLLLDKEKDLDKSMDTKMSQAKIESVVKPILKQKNKELQEQQVPEVAPSLNQKENKTEMTAQTTNKTPKKSSPSPESETYDLTPAPDSSTYDFSDEEENEPKGKPIPSWASGVLLKSALIHQFYNPPDTDAIFGTYVEAPNLAVLFGVKKNYYFKRTSSAVWNTTPN